MKTIDESAVHHDQGFEDPAHHGKRSFLKKRIHSVSDPGLPPLKAENRPPKTPSPLPEGGSEVEDKPIIKEQDFQQLEEQKSHQGNNNINNTPAAGFLVSNILVLGHIIRSNTLRNKVIFKWLLIVLNIVVEVFQATISQERNEGKMGRLLYLKLSIITSSTCFTMALVEAFYEVQKYGVVWQKRGCCCWLYSPGDQGRLFGSFSLYFGLISSMIQLIINVTENLIIKRNTVQFDYIPLLLSVCYMLAAMVGSREKKSAATPIRCSVHPDVEGTLIEDHERRLFQCPQCQIDVFVEHNGS